MSLLVNVVRVFVDEDGDHGNPLAIVWASSATQRREQQIAADLGFSETIFVDAVAGGSARARIYTPTRELPFAGHPTVGLAAWLHASGDDVRQIDVPAGSARVRVEGDLVFVTARSEWAPEFELVQLDGPAAVGVVDPDAFGYSAVYVWAWADEEAGRVRARMFAPDLGIREDEATGSAAVRLTAALGRDLEVFQGQGSRLYTHNRYLGQQVEVGGRVSSARTIELR
ncbi:PhzF family phenazine biosynthesis protein [Microbacterium sp. P02]|uniref:PhzF family phenazine biosynthesis protein n=1 Tax=unclassified Microbacterium TaxID=2609290 RepID=UPI00366FBA09